MATAIDVMKYIKAKKRLTGEVQLQKLVYYSQAWSLAWDGAPLFHDKIEAWRHGPVCRSIYKRTDTADATALTPQERATVDAVLTYYGTMPGATLSQMSHEEKPWADVWGDRRSDETCSDEITHDVHSRGVCDEADDGSDDTEGDPAAGEGDLPVERFAGLLLGALAALPEYQEHDQ